VVDCLFVVLAQRDLPATEASLERTHTAAQAKRTRRARRAAPALPAGATPAPPPAPVPPGGTPPTIGDADSAPPGASPAT
jgi:hypothetical protein